MKKAIVTVTLICIMLAVSGCKAFVEKPAGGYMLKPQLSHQIDQGLDTAEEIAEAAVALGLIWPGAAGIGGIVLGLIAAARKLKPRIEQANSVASASALVVNDVVGAIEVYKRNHSQEWEAGLKQILKSMLSASAKAAINKAKDK